MLIVCSLKILFRVNTTILITRKHKKRKIKKSNLYDKYVCFFDNIAKPNLLEIGSIRLIKNRKIRCL